MVPATGGVELFSDAAHSCLLKPKGSAPAGSDSTFEDWTEPKLLLKFTTPTSESPLAPEPCCPACSLRSSQAIPDLQPRLVPGWSPEVSLMRQKRHKSQTQGQAEGKDLGYTRDKCIADYFSASRLEVEGVKREREALPVQLEHH